MKIREFVALHIEEFPEASRVLGVKPNTQATKSTQRQTSERKTIAEFDFNNKVIKLMKTNPVYVSEPVQFDSITNMYKQAWFILHSPKLCAVTFTVNFYGSTILSMIRYAEMIHLTIDIIVPNGKFHSSREYSVWYAEQQTRKDEFNISVENINLMVQHCPELLTYAKRSNDELLEVLRSQVQNSGYDVSMYSVTTQDGLNHGKIEDELGRPTEWSRDYTKHYERYNQTLNDLLLMYISCKFYAQHGIDKDTDGIGRHDVDSYTGGNLATASVNALTWTARHDYGIVIDFETASTLCRIHNFAIDEPAIPDREEVVVPRSACGLGLQNYMN